MNKIILIMLILEMSNTAYSQFTLIPTGTHAAITDIARHNDTLIISGKKNYFAKSYDMGKSIIPFNPPGLSGYTNFDFQIVNGYYYILSIEGMPYNHNMILKSIDYGASWQTLYDHEGLFTELTMLDTTFGVMGGSFGSYVMTQGSDTAWVLDSLYSTITATESYGDSTMLMMTFGSTSYVTQNQGKTWTWASGTTYDHEEIQFLNKDTVYTVTHKGTENPTSYFYYSVDGGYNWLSISIGHNARTSQYDYYSRVFDLYFDSPRHGYILGYNYSINEAMILETNDYGIHWAMNPLGITDELYDIEVINDSIAFLGGENGTLINWNRLAWKRSLQDSLSTSLNATAASCPTCCDVCINLTVTGGCPPFIYSWLPHDPTWPPCAACPGITYTITIIDSCGISITDSIHTDTLAVPTAIRKPIIEPTFTIYPNPSQNTVTLELGSKIQGKTSIILTDLTGKLIKTIAVDQHISIGQKLSFSIKEFSQGLYFVTLQNGQKRLSRKLFIN